MEMKGMLAAGRRQLLATRLSPKLAAPRATVAYHAKNDRRRARLPGRMPWAEVQSVFRTQDMEHKAVQDESFGISASRVVCGL